MTAAAGCWPPGLPRQLDYPEVPVTAVLAGSARRFGDRVAVRHGEATLTYRQLWDRSCQLANGLRARGLGPGDVVAVHLPNCLQYPIVYYGLLLAGATFCPVNPLLPVDQLAGQLADSAAAVVVTWEPVAGAVAAARELYPVRLVVLTGPAHVADLAAHTPPPDGHGLAAVDLSEMLAGQPEQAPSPLVDPARALAHLAYTGGTTGVPKGVEITHRNVVANVVQYACWGTGSLPAVDDARGLVLDQYGSAAEWPVRLGTGVVINLAPWFHAMGTIGYLNAHLLVGTTIIVHDRFDPQRYLADAERFRVTTIGGAPPIFVALLRSPEIASRDLSSVRGLASGAAPLPVSVIEALQARFPDAAIGEGYGLTEVTMGATAAPAHRSGVRKPGTVGLPVPDTEVRIVALDGSGQALPTGTAGEIWVRGPQVMRGYRNRPEETAAVLSDGWLHTGDIGQLDSDGYLSIVDRKKDVLIYKGYNVYPRELEELLLSHPSVAQAAVVGRPDLAAGELPVAFVVLRPERHASAAELSDYVAARVVPYKRLREVRLVESIPVSAAGKVLRRELRRALRSADLSNSADLTNPADLADSADPG